MGGVAPGEPARLVKMTDEEYFANPRMSRSDLFTYRRAHRESVFTGASVWKRLSHDGS